MDAVVTRRKVKPRSIFRLNSLAFLWAQAQGFSACAMEVSLPRCRYRADVAGYRSAPETNWIDSGLRMQTSALRFAARQLPHRMLRASGSKRSVNVA